MQINQIISEVKVWDGWAEKYKEFVPKFIEEAKNKNTWQEWDTITFNEFFEKSNDQCVSSLQQGYYTNVEKEKIKKNWSELALLLKKIASQQDQMDFATYDEIKKWFGKHTSQNRKAATNRLIASLQPNLLCTIVNEDSLRTLIKKINKLDTTAKLNRSWNWFENSSSVLNYFKEKITHENVYDIMTYPWQTYELLTKKKSEIHTNEMSDNNELNTIIELLKYKKQIILQGPPGTGKTRMAKEIAKDILGLSDVEGLENNDQFKLIQFHPSYTYEDFVRGIVAKPSANGTGITYEAENKTLGLFAKEALENYKNSKSTTSLQQSVDTLFNAFTIEISSIIDKEEKFIISDKVYIDFVDNHFFKYKGDNWKSKPNGINMDFSELKKIINLGLNSREEINNNETLNSATRDDATYFHNVIQLFNDFSQKVLNKEEKNYVLIIDEINRANLSSVLGELIYALEYRGEAVESIYEVDGNELILPPNLYIIGTMNTADRSVGHIDYAIRRRFAFVDVLPKNLKSELNDDFKEDLFIKVANLFIKNYDFNIEKNKIERSDYLSNEFGPKDVWLGHSYFIQQYVKDQNGNDNKSQPIDFNLRVEFEIKPILREYLKDGVFMGGKQIDGKDIKTYIEELA